MKAKRSSEKVMELGDTLEIGEKRYSFEYGECFQCAFWDDECTADDKIKSLCGEHLFYSEIKDTVEK